ncbi:hypothetical protein [Streptomyces sp. MNP-20]|uniref:hypothetical protein n=1 Tax=Streptomyces sp. MNP-20 TaxID=2721165 RepID=UPI0015554C7E|nr:hypothetical protein [Streptomyces sp. MNP-20]
MTERNVVRGTLVSGTTPDGSNTSWYFARLRAFAVTLGLGPFVVLTLSLVLACVGQWPPAACVALAGIGAAAARGSQVQFLWVRVD